MPLRSFLAAGLFFAAISGCASSPEKDYTTVRPTTPPVRATTNFDGALRCMDEMLLRSEISGGIRVFPRPLDDPSGSVAAATNDMIAASALKMSSRSRFLQVWNSTIPNVQDTLTGNVNISLEIGGSITAYDRAVTGQSRSAGLSAGGDADIGVRAQGQNSVVTVTLKFVNARSGLIEPGTLSSASMVVRSSSKGGDLTGQIESFGGFLEIQFEQNEGLHQAVNTLIDLAMIEAVGNYAKLPFHKCLATIGTDPAAVQMARKAYDKLNPVERQLKVADELKARGYLDPATDHKVISQSFRTAIADYQFEHGLPALGLPSFELYYALFADQYGAPVVAPLARVDDGVALEVTQVEVPARRLLEDGTYSAYDVVYPYERMKFGVSVADAAYVMCYYTDAMERTTLVYPSIPRSNVLIQPGQQLSIPGPSDGFSIQAGATLKTLSRQVLSQPPYGYVERVMCFGSDEPLMSRITDERATTYLSKTPITESPDEFVASLSEQLGDNHDFDEFIYVVRPNLGG